MLNVFLLIVAKTPPVTFSLESKAIKHEMRGRGITEASGELFQTRMRQMAFKKDNISGRERKSDFDI